MNLMPAIIIRLRQIWILTENRENAYHVILNMKKGLPVFGKSLFHGEYLKILFYDKSEV